MRADWRAVLGLLITAVLLWLVLRGVDLGHVWSEIRGANFGLLGLSVAIVTGTFLLRALRWKVLLEPVRPGTSLHSRFAAVNIGFMANNLLPARVGEFARAFALARLEPVSMSAAFGSLVVERFLDGLVIVFYMFVAMAMPSFPAEPSLGEVSLGAVIEGVTLILAALLGGMVLLLLFPKPIIGAVERGARFLPRSLSRKVVEGLEAFLEGLGVFQSPRLLLLSLLWSLGVWAWQSLGFWVGFRAFGINVGYDAALFTNAIVGFAVGVPSSPGFFGTFHWGARLGLGVYGVAPASTLAFAFGFHLGGFIPVTLIGLYFVWRLGLSLGEVEKSEEVVEEAIEEAHPELATVADAPPAGPEQRGSA